MDKQQRSKAQKIQKTRRRFEAREMIYALKKSTPCEDCNTGFHPCQIDIVRKDGSKSAQLSKVLHKSKKFIVEEIKKCDFVCSNCNRMRTWEYQRKQRMEKEPITEAELLENPVEGLDEKSWEPG